MTLGNRTICKAAGLAVCIVWLTGASGYSQTNQAYKAALKGLKTCLSLLTTEDMAEFGFHSTDELGLARLGEPFPVYDLSLSLLRKWQPTQDLNRVFAKAERMLFPVMVTQDVRASIAVTKGTFQWRPAEFGGSALARLYARERERSAQATGLPLSAYFCAQVPALHAYLVGYSATNGLMLISVVNAPELRLEAGVPVLAPAVFQRLVRTARRHGPEIR